MRALLLQFNAEPPASLFEGRGRADRMKIMEAYYAPKKARLRKMLGYLPVHVQDVEALGAVIVRGPAPALDSLQRPGLLARLEVSVADDVAFVPLDDDVPP